TRQNVLASAQTFCLMRCSAGTRDETALVPAIEGDGRPAPDSGDVADEGQRRLMMGKLFSPLARPRLAWLVAASAALVALGILSFAPTRGGRPAAQAEMTLPVAEEVSAPAFSP